MKLRLFCLFMFVSVIATSPSSADEIWVAPTYQADIGGIGVGTSFFWPVTPIGVVRFAFGVPDNLDTFTSAKVVLIPESPGGATTLGVFVCAAQDTDPVGPGLCSGQVDHAFVGVVDQLHEIDITAAVAPSVGAAGLTNLAVLAYTAPTTLTDRIVGMRFVYDLVAPVIPPASITTAELAFDPATQVELDSHAGDLAAHHPRYTDAEAIAAALAGGVATLGANTYTATQTINTGNLDLDPSTAATGNLTKDNTRFLHNFGTINTFLGVNAGNFTMTGGANTATGVDALSSNTTGNNNTASGVSALVSNTTSFNNTASGVSALVFNTTGSNNTASGFEALFSDTTGSNNTASGFGALHDNTTGSRNTASGREALHDNTTGHANVAVGRRAGFNATTGNLNIYLGTGVLGVAGESNTIRLGLPGTHTHTLIGGIRGITTGQADAVSVLIDSTGQLGTVSSSRRVKQDIADMRTASQGLLDLRPVTFRYREAYSDGSKPIQYGLIAEEVAEVYPDLVVYDETGQPETVQYRKVNAMLLNEVQQQHRVILELLDRVERLERSQTN